MLSDDDLLIERIRAHLCDREGYSERKMFGTVCFMIHGNMCAGTWKGDLIVRLPKELHDQTLSMPHTKPADMTGRIMTGWALIGPSGTNTEIKLDSWLNRSVEYAQSLPAK